jgi:hypothetical protein
LIEITVPEQHLQLDGGKRASLAYPAEATLGQSLVAKPEALPVVDEETQCRAALVAENKEGSREGIALEGVAGDPAEPVYAFSEINRLCTNKDAHVGSDLDHRVPARNAAIRGWSCEQDEALISM